MKTKQPFVVKHNDTTTYYKDSTCTCVHRVDGPAIVYKPSTQKSICAEIDPIKDIVVTPTAHLLNTDVHYEIWMQNGKIHRIGGPSKTYEWGQEEWYVRGKLHREDGPAVTYSDGTQEWFIHGKIHRLDGVASTVKRAYPMWAVNNKIYTSVDEYNKAVNHWLGYREVTKQEIINLIGNYRIVEW